MSLFGPVGTLLLTLVSFVFIMTVVVFFHELGHFLVGRWCGVKVDAFSIGFGPEIYGRVDAHGTRWRVAAVPLGGYVKFHGDMNAASAGIAEGVAAMPEAERALTFQAKSVGRRAAIVAAGPIANFILALVVLTGLIYAEGRPSPDPRIGGLVADSAAARAGFEPGDVIRSIDGKPVASFAAMHDLIAGQGGVPLRFEVDRDGLSREITATPDVRDVKGPGGQTRVGVLGVEAVMERIGLVQSMSGAANGVWAVVAGTGHYVGGLILGREKADQLSGPIGIASVAGQAARMGFGMVLNVVAILSVSIGLINLVPVPLLDGGHLLYFAFEALRGRPMSLGAQEFGFKVGLALVSMLMIFATYNDILHFVRG